MQVNFLIKNLFQSLNIKVEKKELTKEVNELFFKALSHKSFFFKNPKELKLIRKKNTPLLEDYDRLEFLGDSILKFVINSYLFENYQTHNSGELTRLSAYLLSDKVLTEIGEECEIKQYIQVARYIPKKQILADVLESIFGAHFLAFGLVRTRKLILELYKCYFLIAEEKSSTENYKARLQELAQLCLGSLPKYTLVKTDGPAHKSTFFVEATLLGKTGLGIGQSKKEAEQKAAKELLAQLETN